jgi:hypothetical protein
MRFDELKVTYAKAVAVRTLENDTPWGAVRSVKPVLLILGKWQFLLKETVCQPMDIRFVFIGRRCSILRWRNREITKEPRWQIV